MVFWAIPNEIRSVRLFQFEIFFSLHFLFLFSLKLAIVHAFSIVSKINEKISSASHLFNIELNEHLCEQCCIDDVNKHFANVSPSND